MRKARTYFTIALCTMLICLLGCDECPPCGTKPNLLQMISDGNCDYPNDCPDEATEQDPITPPPPPPPQSCCAVEFTTNVVGEAPGDRYYWLGLVNADTLILHGDSVYVPASYVVGLPLTLQVTYLDSVPPGEYSLRIFTSDNAGKVGDIRKRMSAGEAGRVQVPSFALSDCEQCCSPAKGHAGIDYGSSLIQGASAYFEVRYGQYFCGDAFDTNYAYSIVYVCVGKPDSRGDNGLIWAQAGFGKIRLPGSSVVDYIRYLEVVGNQNATDTSHQRYRKQQFLTGPYESGVSLDLKVQYDLNLKVWRGFIASSSVPFLTSWSVPVWDSTWGTFVQLSGEVQNREDDMFGTLSSMCLIDQARCQSAFGTFDLIDFNPTNSEFIRDDPAEWQVDTIGNVVGIWDVRPR